MNSILIIVVIAVVATVHAEESPDRMEACAKEFSLTPDEVKSMQFPIQSTLVATENMKCFAKCTIEGSDIVSPDGSLDVEKIVQMIAEKGKDESKVREMAEKCKTLYKKNSTCDEAFTAFKCLMSTN